jgi:hypothetical protein
MTPLDLAHSLDTAGKTCKMVKLLQKAKVQHGAGRGRGQLPQNTAPLRQRGTPALPITTASRIASSHVPRAGRAPAPQTRRRATATASEGTDSEDRRPLRTAAIPAKGARKQEEGREQRKQGRGLRQRWRGAGHWEEREERG